MATKKSTTPKMPMKGMPPKGMHKMGNGMMMKDSEMKPMMGAKKSKK